MPDLAAVAAASWKDRGQSDGGLLIPYAGGQRRFLEALVGDPAAEDEVVPILALARLGQSPVAALLSLRHGNRLTAIVIFRTEALPAASPGLLLVGRMMDWAAERGLEGYDLNATQDWTRYIVDEVRAQDIVVCFSRTVRGRAMGLVSAAARRAT
jgi:CelD/BcsL family acetyltransferase involved in cellulose biosynthesis